MSRVDDRTILINLTTRTFSQSVRSSLDFYKVENEKYCNVPYLREHGIVTGEIAANPRSSTILTLSVALQLRWQYMQRIRGDYRAHETISSRTAQTGVNLAEQIVTIGEGSLNAQHP